MNNYFPSSTFETGNIQTSIFQGSEQQLQFAELCNALFEACLTDIANQNTLELPKLTRRLAGLSHHIKSAAFKLLTIDNHLDVDIHNGSWQYKQSRKIPTIEYQDEAMALWYHKYSCFGLPVPVLIQEIDQFAIELDSIDKMDLPNDRIHLNKNGWVELKSTTANQVPLSKGETRAILQKPNKAIMTAACCGHRWNHRGVTHPRRLSLRELLLSTSISWKNFRFPI